MEKKDRWHGAHHYSNKIHLVLLAFLVLTSLTIYGSYLGMNKVVDNASIEPSPSPSASVSVSPSPTPTEAVFCTLDAKLCPDGSYVARTGPKCEFVCPTITTSPTPTPTLGCNPRPKCLKDKPPCEVIDVCPN